MTELEQYDYPLPRELIAQEPLRRRSDARLMIVDRQRKAIEHLHVRDLPEMLRPGDTLVLNDSRVIPAKLVGYRDSTGGRWQGLFLEADEQGAWRLLGKTRGKLAPGETVTLQDRQSRDAIQLQLVARDEEGAWLARPASSEPPLAILERVGRTPLPHYIRRLGSRDEDARDYQTVYAERPGSVAAPTAGLHFTKELLQELQTRGVGITRVTLHVGIGTFRPIAVGDLSQHEMHAEWGQIEAEASERLNTARARGGRIVAVGTTSVRVLESAAAGGRLQPWRGETDLFIRPPHEFQAVDALMTNFHLPKSTLLVLVRTFGGDALLRQAYEAAVAQRYRFFSYGDAMLIV